MACCRTRCPRRRYSCSVDLFGEATPFPLDSLPEYGAGVTVEEYVRCGDGLGVDCGTLKTAEFEREAGVCDAIEDLKRFMMSRNAGIGSPLSCELPSKQVFEEPDRLLTRSVTVTDSPN